MNTSIVKFAKFLNIYRFVTKKDYFYRMTHIRKIIQFYANIILRKEKKSLVVFNLLSVIIYLLTYLLKFTTLILIIHLYSTLMVTKFFAFLTECDATVINL